MPRVARAVARKIDRFPWYEWTEEFEWEDDEFEDRKWGTIEERRRKAEALSRGDVCLPRPDECGACQ